jgi:hypothetical protein
MSAILKHVLRWFCPHRFSWPHSGVHGQDYQICLRCGTAFEYDTTPETFLACLRFTTESRPLRIPF